MDWVPVALDKEAATPMMMAATAKVAWRLNGDVFKPLHLYVFRHAISK